MSASFSKFVNIKSSLLRGLNDFGWSFRSFFKGATMQAKFLANRRKTLHNLRTNHSLLRLFGACSPLLTFFVRDTISRRRGQITRLK